MNTQPVTIMRGAQEQHVMCGDIEVRGVKAVGLEWMISLAWTYLGGRHLEGVREGADPSRRHSPVQQ